MGRSSLIAVLLLGIVAGSPAGADEMDIEEVRAAVDAGNAQWMRAFAEQDAELLAEVFTDDGVMLAAGERVIRRGEIAESMGAVMEAMGPAGRTIETGYLWLDGDTAYEYGYYEYRYTIEGEEVSTDGHYLVVWRYEDGCWRIAMDLGLPGD